MRIGVEDVGSEIGQGFEIAEGIVSLFHET